MAGTFTSKRVLNEHTFTSYSYPDGVVRDSSPLITPRKVPDCQVTTSFRSGGKYEPDPVTGPIEGIVYENARVAIVSEHDTGHEFDTWTQKFSFNPRIYEISVSGLKAYQLPLVPDHAGLGSFTSIIPRMSENDILSMGARAIKATQPSNPEAGLLQAVAELKRDGIPQIPALSTLKKKSPSSAGGDYLNVEFGWAPLISDVRKLAQAVLNTSRILAQYKRDSGKVVRRRFQFPISVTESTWTADGSTTDHLFVGVPRGMTPLDVEGMRPTVHTLKKERVWFSGAYSYYVDPGDSVLGKLAEYEQLANKLLGTRLTPAVLWELAPWSWLADWQSTIGVGLSNASTFQSDGLVMRYGYLMRETRIHRTVTQKRVNWWNNQVTFQPGTTSSTLHEVRKERYRATPYGFGLDLSLLSGRQWAILAALGMTKGDRVGW